MLKQSVILCAAVAALVTAPASASAEWLFTGYVAPIFNVKTAESEDLFVPAEHFDSSVGWGLNLASAFASRANLGFELDVGFYPKAMQMSDAYDPPDTFASRLLGISTNFFYSPSIPRFRPYFSVGPTFHYRSDRDESLGDIPSGWGVGINGGGGLMIFANERFGGRVDVRYFRNFGDFYDLSSDATSRRSGWKDLQYFRIFFGGTVVLG